MLNTFWTYLQYGKRFCGVEHSTQNESEILNATVLLQSKKELNISVSLNENTVEGLSKHLPKHQHIVLIINNEKVLSKTIENEQSDALKLVYSAFPNPNPRHLCRGSTVTEECSDDGPSNCSCRDHGYAVLFVKFYY